MLSTWVISPTSTCLFSFWKRAQAPELCGARGWDWTPPAKHIARDCTFLQRSLHGVPHLQINRAFYENYSYFGNSGTVQMLGETGETICNWSAWRHIAGTFLGEMHWALNRDNRRAFPEISRAPLRAWLGLRRGSKFRGPFQFTSHFASLQNPA